ncbi:hypothetical protein [Streptomyces sp. TS71-3]|uniref:hypothetical protein n=1 Tax=Streptomyces sp. TS71-3 TaxID=2733862 RepID=UPI001B0AD454|nr:hypothetical protein [Streptomyces sp. TS71-3]GHJ36944.1 hypothetical protein Sm713_25530 [Streptomyces sp. TS71-3]
MHRPRPTALLAALTALTACAAATALAAGPAAASEQPDPHGVTGTVDAPAGLNLRSGSPTGTVVGTMPRGTRAHVDCWVPGPSVTGPFGATTVWDAVDSYTTPTGDIIDFNGRVLASDAWIDTGGDTSRMVPRC